MRSPGFAAGGLPVRFELGGRRCSGGTLEIERQVEPRCHPVGSAEIFRREVAPARPHERTVGDRPFAVIAQIAWTRCPACEERTENRRLDAGRMGCAEPLARQLHGAHTIDQESHSHAAPHAGHHAQRRLLAERVLTQNISAHIELSSGAVHEVEQGGRAIGAVGVHAHVRRRGARQAEALDEVFGPVLGRGAHARPRRDLARQFSAAEQQVRGQGEIGQRDQTQHPRDRDRRRTAFVLGARGEHVREQAQRDDERVAGDAGKPGVHELESGS